MRSTQGCAGTVGTEPPTQSILYAADSHGFWLLEIRTWALWLQLGLSACQGWEKETLFGVREKSIAWSCYIFWSCCTAEGGLRVWHWWRSFCAASSIAGTKRFGFPLHPGALLSSISTEILFRWEMPLRPHLPRYQLLSEAEGGRKFPSHPFSAISCAQNEQELNLTALEENSVKSS